MVEGCLSSHAKKRHGRSESDVQSHARAAALPLETGWCLHAHRPALVYVEGMLLLGHFATVAGFWEHMNHARLGAGLVQRSAPQHRFHCITLFRAGVMPTWEDPRNCRGFKALLTRLDTDGDWLDVCMACVGEQLPGATGARIVAKIMPRGPVARKIEVWFEHDAPAAREEALAALRAHVPRARDVRIHRHEPAATP